MSEQVDAVKRMYDEAALGYKEACQIKFRVVMNLWKKRLLWLDQKLKELGVE